MVKGREEPHAAFFKYFFTTNRFLVSLISIKQIPQIMKKDDAYTSKLHLCQLPLPSWSRAPSHTKTHLKTPSVLLDINLDNKN